MISRLQVLLGQYRQEATTGTKTTKYKQSLGDFRNRKEAGVSRKQRGRGREVWDGVREMSNNQSIQSSEEGS